MNIGWSFALGRLVPAGLAVALAFSGSAGAATGGLSVTTTAFSPGATVPGWAAYTGCVKSAANRSPDLTWKGAPAQTKSFALTLFDPDAPTGHGFFHWVLFNMPAAVTHLAVDAGNPMSHAAVAGAIAGRSDFGFSHYGGPCPPKGDKPHRYLFTVYALDVPKLAGADPNTTGAQFEHAIAGHVLAKGSVTGIFSR
jgi:Raf kinase inhibitor-like YbhB/YbcL family protein